MEKISAEKFLRDSLENSVIDVRSPGEYAIGHIPGAVNIPLFNDSERAVIGTLYNKEGREPAVQKGLEMVGHKMVDFSKKAINLAVSGKLLVYCWRGGMRSESMAWIYEKLGIKCHVLEGGYKAYRNYLMTETGNVPNLIVIEGATGSGKSGLLLSLSKIGEQIIDLEKLANHKGSVFGGIGMGEQPSTQQFQNNLLGELIKLDRTNRIFVEGESLAIGKVFLPAAFWETMNKAFIIKIDVPLRERIIRLTKDYGGSPEEEMKRAIESLGRRIGEVRKNEILDDYSSANLETAAEKLIHYYDMLYSTSTLKHKKIAMSISFPDGNTESNAKILLNQISKIH